jgi:hypothetical protein
MNVQTAAGRHPGQQTPQGKISMSWVLWATAHTGTMETCNSPGVVQYVWTILVLSILDANIYNIYTMHYARKHMKLWKIGRATYIAGTLKWNYKKHHVDLAIPAYVKKQLTKYSHVAPLNHSIARMHPIPSNTAKTTNHPLPLTKILA